MNYKYTLILGLLILVFAQTVSASFTEVDSTGLVGYYPLYQDFDDYSGNNNDGIPYNTDTILSLSMDKHDSGIIFDGTGYGNNASANGYSLDNGSLVGGVVVNDSGMHFDGVSVSPTCGIYQTIGSSYWMVS